MLLSVAVAVDLQVSTLTLIMVLVGAKRSLAVMVEPVVIVTLTLKSFLVHITLQSVAVERAVLMVGVQLLELQQLVLV
jgi:hypothetical protein